MARQVMKTMKAMKKAKRVSKIAKGRRAKLVVFRGTKEKTKSGLTREMLMKNKRGKVVSKRANAAGKRKFHQIKGWMEAFMKARSSLNLKGFVAINGRSLVGKALYVKTKALHGVGAASASSGSASAGPGAACE